MEETKEEKLKAKARKISIAEGSAYSVMDGFGLRYITPYAIALGVSNAFIGLLSSFPGLIGSFSQILSSKMIEKHSRKKIVTNAVLLQAIMWLPLFSVGLIALFLKTSIIFTSIALVVLYTLLIMVGSFSNPAWSSWMKDIVEKNTDSYFAKRNLTLGTVGLISTFIAGFILEYFNKFNFLIGFGIIFSIALIGRGTSAYLFTKKYEPKRKKVEGSYFSFFQFIKKMPSNNFGRFVIFSAIVSFATAIASPFFAVYMLKDLGFSYISYTSVVVSAIVMMLVSMPLWGRLGDKYGNIVVLKLTGYFIFSIPLLWLAIPFFFKDSTTIIAYLILVEAFSGFVWAGFNLSTGNFLYYAITPQRIALCSAYNAVLTALGAFLGATLGGLISSTQGKILFLEPILFVFALSSILRFGTVIFMLPKIKEVREVEKFGFEEIRKKMPEWPRQVLHAIGAGIKRVGFS